MSTKRSEKARAIIDRHRGEMTIYAFAKRLEIPRQTILNWHTGAFIPDYKTLIKLVKTVNGAAFAKELLEALYAI